MKLRILPFLIILSACARQYNSQLIDIESYINENPDSALNVISGISPGDLHNRRDRALHSLLYAMALDKCYIDTTDVSVIQPAYEYYRFFGTPDYRLKTAYYHARIAENSGDPDRAKEILVRYGDKFLDQAEDYSFVGKYLMMHCVLSKLVFDFDSAMNYAKRAKEKYLRCDDKRGLATACFGLSTCYICTSEFRKAENVLSEVYGLWESLDDYRKCEYYSEMIYIKINLDEYDQAKSLADECVAKMSHSIYMPWVEVMNTYVKLGLLVQAREVMTHIRNIPNEDNDGYFAVRKAELFAACGEFEQAYLLEHECIDNIWNQDKFAVESNIRHVDARIADEISKVKMRYAIYLLVFTICVVSVILCSLSYMLHKRKQQTVKLSAELAHERKELLLAKESVAMGKDMRDLIDERINLINKVLMDRMSDSMVMKKENLKEMDKILGDRQSFVSSIAILFSISHPKFISYLRDKKLSDVQIGYSCLLVQGLSGKEIASIFSLTRFYNSSSEVRAKLGLGPNDMNLSNYLKTLLPLDD